MRLPFFSISLISAVLTCGCIDVSGENETNNTPGSVPTIKSFSVFGTDGAVASSDNGGTAYLGPGTFEIKFTTNSSSIYRVYLDLSTNSTYNSSDDVAVLSTNCNNGTGKEVCRASADWSCIGTESRDEFDCEGGDIHSSSEHNYGDIFNQITRPGQGHLILRACGYVPNSAGSVSEKCNSRSVRVVVE